MRKKTIPKVKVNAAEHATGMARKVGVDRARSIALGLIRSLSDQNYTKIHNEKEINSLKHFWANVLGVLGNK